MSCWMNCWIFEEKYVKPLALAAMIIGCDLAQADCDVRFCEAKPVWPVGRATRINDTVRFVGTFAAGAGDAAVLQVTGSTCYRVRLNGEFLAFGPVRGPKGIFRVDQLSLKGKLASGDNRLEIIRPAVANGPELLVGEKPVRANRRLGQRKHNSGNCIPHRHANPRDHRTKSISPAASNGDEPQTSHWVFTPVVPDPTFQMPNAPSGGVRPEGISSASPRHPGSSCRLEQTMLTV